MASSLTPSYRKSYKYDVYLSFSGEDVIKKFIDHLYAALQRQGIRTFKDYEMIPRGRTLAVELFQAIKESRMFIIVFSKNYASSSWCLDELVKIIECDNMTDQTAYVVFYDVKPTEVRKESWVVGKAFDKFKIEEWREALDKACNLSAWHLNSKYDGGEAKIIENIVERISLKLPSFDLSIDEKAVGMVTPIKSLQKKILSDVSGDKSITVSSVYKGSNLIKKKLHGKRILLVLDDVADSSQLEALFGDPHWFETGSRIINTTRYQHATAAAEAKVLEKYFFAVVTRSFRVLSSLDVALAPYLQVLQLDERQDSEELHKTLEVPKVVKFLKLIKLKLQFLDLRLALNLEVLKIKECHDLVELRMPYKFIKLRSLNLSHLKLRILDLGMAPNLDVLKIEGCHDLVEFRMPTELGKLRSLNLSQLKFRTLDLGLAPNLEVLKIKRCHDLVEFHMPTKFISLWSLNLSHLKLRTLDLGLAPNVEVLKIKGCDDLVEFHMPTEFISLWYLNLSFLKLRTLDLMLAPNLEVLKIKECLKLTSLILIRLKLSTFELSHVPNLEMLMIEDCNDLKQLNIFPECLNLKSLELGHLKVLFLDLSRALNLEVIKIKECHDLVDLHMPPKSRKLISLELNHLKLRTLELCEAPNLDTISIECLKLRSLNIGHSKLRTLDLRLTPNLEMLDLQDCHHLTELHTPIGCLKRLVFLNLSGCSKFNSFLFIKQLKSLEVLCLTRLYLKEFPDVIPRHLHERLLEFRFRYNDIYELPSSIENLQRLLYLDLHSCRKLKVLPGSICSLRNLRNLKLYGCSLEELPEDIGRLQCLEKLNLSFTRIKHLPDSICMLKNLKTLNLSSCWNLEKLPEDIGQLECLQKLILSECTQLRDVPNSICMLKELKYLSFLDCIQLQKLPEELGNLRRLEELNINGTRIRFLPPSISLLTELKIRGPKSGIRGIKSNESASQIKDSEKALKAEGEYYSQNKEPF